MGLKDDLAEQPRDDSGSSSSNRFAFQQNWALCHLLGLHEVGKDYAVIMERHDDVVVTDGASDPKNIDCYQVKTKEQGRWSLNDLLYRKKGKMGEALSILGKMCDNCLRFKEKVRSLSFVSNARYNVTLEPDTKSDNRDRICLEELTAASRTQINTQLKAEHSLATDPMFTSIAHLRVTDLSLQGHSTHATGKLVEFMERTKPGAYAIPALYRTLAEEIKRRTDFEMDLTHFEEVMKRKGLTRSQFETMLDSVPEKKSFESIWTAISAQLTSEGVAYSVTLGLKQASRRYEVDRMTASNTVLRTLRDIVTAEVTILQEKQEVLPLQQMIDRVSAAVEARRTSETAVFDSVYIKAMIILEIHEY